MGKKGRKTRWRKLPIPIGEGGQKEEIAEVPEHNHSHNHKTTNKLSSPTYNNDEYTKIITPRQDMLFKKGSFVKKKTSPSTTQDPVETQSAGSMESDQYMCDEQPQYPYSYVDPSNGGVYYMNNGYEYYDPYYGNMTVVVGPPAGQYGGGAHPVLAAVPCQPVPLQSLEWFNPAAPQPPYCLPLYPTKKTKSVDSQSCSRQSSESTVPGSPGSPQEVESPEQSGVYMQPYMYPGYMFGAPVYNVNGVSVQGVVLPPAPQPADQTKRRKKRLRRTRGAVADEGSESSYEEVLSCEAEGGSQSGASSDTAAPDSSSSSKTTSSDSGVAPDLPNSGSNSPQPTADFQPLTYEIDRAEEKADIYQICDEILNVQNDVCDTLNIEEISPPETEVLNKESTFDLSDCEEVFEDFKLKEVTSDFKDLKIEEYEVNIENLNIEEENFTEILNKEPIIERPITEAVTKWLQTNASTVTTPLESDESDTDDDDELTGQKNVKGNPFLASSRSGARTRVADDGLFLDRVAAMCDPKTSVDKYYRLSPVDKNAFRTLHISPGPFPCGVCCIIQ